MNLQNGLSMKIKKLLFMSVRACNQLLKCFAPFIIFLSVLFANSYSFSSNLGPAPSMKPITPSHSQKIVVDGKMYSRGQIIRDFLNVAFSDRLWNSDANGENASEILFDSLVKYRDYYMKNTKGEQSLQDLAPWYYKHMYAWEARPRHNAINKFHDKIAVSIDWPSYNNRSDQKEYFNKLEDKSIYPLFESIIKSSLTEIEKFLSVPITYVPFDDDREFTPNYARVRIVPMQSWPGRVLGGSNPYTWSPAYNEESLINGVLLYSENNKIMDGYLLPDKNNHIDLSICKIKSTLDKPEINIFIRKCLIKSLGLPEITELNDKSILSEINYPLPVDEIKPSQYDFLMLHLLYCEAIEAGMDKNHVVNILATHDECFGDFLVNDKGN